MNSLKAFTDEEISEELKRREELRAGSWPRQYSFNLELDISEDSDYADFLVENCGFIEFSQEFEKANKSVENVTVSVEISRDGLTRISAINGNHVVESRANEADIQAEVLGSVDTLDVGGKTSREIPQ